MPKNVLKKGEKWGIDTPYDHCSKDKKQLLSALGGRS